MLTDDEIAIAVRYRLRVAHLCGEPVVHANYGDFARSLGLACSVSRVRRVIGQLIGAGEVVSSRQQPQHREHHDRPVTYWLPGQPTPDHVVAYRAA